MTKVPASGSWPDEVEVIEHGYTVHLRKAGTECAAYVRWPKERPTMVAAGSREDAINGVRVGADQHIRRRPFRAPRSLYLRSISRWWAKTNTAAQTATTRKVCVQERSNGSTYTTTGPTQIAANATPVMMIVISAAGTTSRTVHITEPPVPEPPSGSGAPEARTTAARGVASSRTAHLMP